MVEVIKTLEDLQAQVSQAADLQEFWKEAIEGNKIPASVLTQAIACKLEGLDKYLHMVEVIKSAASVPHPSPGPE